MRVLALAFLAAGAASSAHAANLTSPGGGLTELTGVNNRTAGLVAPALGSTANATSAVATLSTAQAASAAALGLTDPASAAAFFGLDPPQPPPRPPSLPLPPPPPRSPAVAAPDPSLDDPTPKAGPEPFPCTLTVSADLPHSGAAIPACSPVTVYAHVEVPGGLPAGFPPLDGFITFSTDGIAATAPLRLVSESDSSASISANVTRWRVHPAGKDGTPGGAALTAYYAPAGGNSSACASGSSSPLAVPVKRATPLVSVSPSPAVLAKTASSTCSLADLHAVVNVGAAGDVADCATPTGLVTLHVVRGAVGSTPLRAANLLPVASQAITAKVAQVAAAEVTAAAMKAGHSAAATGSWKQAAAAGLVGARQEATLLALDAVAGVGGGGGDAKRARQAAAATATGATPSQGRAAADVVSTDAPGPEAAAGAGPASLLDRARTLLPPLPGGGGGGLGGFFGRRRHLLGPIKEALDSASLIHRKVGAGVLMPTQLLPGMPGHARILPAGDKVGLRLVPGHAYTLVAQYSGDDNFEKAGGGGELIVEGSCPLA